MPKISVIVPVYNVESFLVECLNSLINQTLKDLEIICINDCSKDNSLSILNEYSKIDKRIIVINQENLGCNQTRNNAIKFAKGDYLSFIDADDYVDLDFFEKLYARTNNGQFDIVMTSKVENFDKNKRCLKNTGVKNKDYKISSLKDRGKIVVTSGMTCNKIYKKDFIIKNNIQFSTLNKTGGDNLFTNIAILLANNIYVTNKTCYYYRQQDKSLTKVLKNKKNFGIINLYKDIENKVNLLNISSIKKNFWINNVINKRALDDIRIHFLEMEESSKKEFKELVHKNYPIVNLDIEPIVSLTSFPKRIKFVSQTIRSILNQSFKPKKIILWLAEDEFPNKEFDLPQALLDLTYQGLEIAWCDNLKSYKKLIPTLKKFPNDFIITADDDVIYHKDSIKTLINDYLKNPRCIICNRGHYIKFKKSKLLPYKQWDFCTKYQKPSYNLLQTGVGMVLYFPNCFYRDILNKNLFLKLASNTDDLWFWAMATMNNIKVKTTDIKNAYDIIPNSQECSLWENYNSYGNNDKNLKLILSYYPQIIKKLSKKDYTYNNFFERFFSIKNDIYKKHKILTILGLKIKINKINKKNKIQEILKEKEKRITNLEYKIKNLNEEVCTLSQKFFSIYNQSLIYDKKFPIKNSIIYIPDYPLDYIQRKIVETGNFYEIKDLIYLDNYLNKNSVIVDIGANIGNHTVYWGKVTNVKKIYSIEPVQATYEKLQMNINLNGLENKVETFNFGLGKNFSKANIYKYDQANSGATTLKLEKTGNIEIKTLDSLKIQEKQISLIKIDTEGFEMDVLEGAIETINKYKPLIYVEIDYKNLQKVESFLEKLNYQKEKQIKESNFLYTPIK